MSFQVFIYICSLLDTKKEFFLNKLLHKIIFFDKNATWIRKSQFWQKKTAYSLSGQLSLFHRFEHFQVKFYYFPVEYFLLYKFSSLLHISTTENWNFIFFVGSRSRWLSHPACQRTKLTEGWSKYTEKVNFKILKKCWYKI